MKAKTYIAFDRSQNILKVGTSDNPSNRMWTLSRQWQCQGKMELVAEFSASEVPETTLIGFVSKFANRRCGNEWFDAPTDSAAYVFLGIVSALSKPANGDTPGLALKIACDEKNKQCELERNA